MLTQINKKDAENTPRVQTALAYKPPLGQQDEKPQCGGRYFKLSFLGIGRKTKVIHYLMVRGKRLSSYERFHLHPASLSSSLCITLLTNLLVVCSFFYMIFAFALSVTLLGQTIRFISKQPVCLVPSITLSTRTLDVSAHLATPVHFNQPLRYDQVWTIFYVNYET